MSTFARDSGTGDTLVLGLGSPNTGDLGVACRALARFQEEWDLGSHVHVALIPETETPQQPHRFTNVLLISALDVGARSGSVVCVEGRELRELVAAGRGKLPGDSTRIESLLSLLPPDTTVIGVQPGVGRLQGPPDIKVREALDGLLAAAVDTMRSWGHPVERRT